MKLYRYIPLEIFIDIVENKRLTFLPPSKWDDGYEGYLIKKLTNEQENTKKLIKQISGASEGTIEAMKNFQSKLTTKCVCWCTQKDSIPMWSAYAHENKSIMIETNYNEIANLEYVWRVGYPGRKVNIRKIEYINEFNLINEIIQNCSEYGFNMEEILSKKRKDFSYESEYRAFILTIEEPNIEYKNVTIKDISTFITDVIVHPLAKDYYVDIIRNLCNKNSIKFSGKSEVFEFK